MLSERSKNVFKRLTGKKGFTLVELIVVIAIVAILATVTVLVVNPSAQKRARANDYAKSFFYNAQEVMSEMKFSNEVTVSAGEKLLLYVHFYKDASYDGTDTSLGRVREVEDGTWVWTAQLLKGSDVLNSGTGDYITPTTSPEMFSILEDTLKGLTEIDESCYFYAYVDEKMRVSSSCWSVCDITEMRTSSFTTDGVNSVGGGLTGAFPGENVQDSGKTVLV